MQKKKRRRLTARHSAKRRGEYAGLAVIFRSGNSAMPAVVPSRLRRVTFVTAEVQRLELRQSL